MITTVLLLLRSEAPLCHLKFNLEREIAKKPHNHTEKRKFRNTAGRIQGTEKTRGSLRHKTQVTILQQKRSHTIIDEDVPKRDIRKELVCEDKGAIGADSHPLLLWRD